jgi:Zn finger protein HypA/HybF involved in hydrogenase expression
MANKNSRQHLETVEEERRFVLWCRKCGYHWAPNPNKWRNTFNPIDPKALNCPRCCAINYIKRKDLKQIILLNT